VAVVSRFDRNEAGGGALVVGYLVVLAGLYRAPSSALEAAMAGPQSVIYFIVLPVTGIAAGVYAYVHGPFSVVALFVLGCYLGFLGLALSLGALLSSNPAGIPLVVGLLGVLCATLALLAGLLQVAMFLRLGGIHVDAD
jgi:hypothetical protein